MDINDILNRFHRGDFISKVESKFALDHMQKIAKLTKIPDYRLVGFDAQRIADRLQDRLQYMKDSHLIKRVIRNGR